MLAITIIMHERAARCSATLKDYMRLVAIPQTPGNERLYRPLYERWHNQTTEEQRYVTH